MKLTFLGTRGNIEARTRRHRMHTSLLVQYYDATVMIDCGLDWLSRFEKLEPKAILITHAHPDHGFGLMKGVPCPVFATEKAWENLADFPIRKRLVVRPGEPLEIGRIVFEPFSIEHSTRAPEVGYRVTAGRTSIFYVPDVVYIHDREKALKGVKIYIGDGAAWNRSLVRKSKDRLIGHTTVQTQLTWCQKEGVPEAIFTHCGMEIVQGDERRLGTEMRKMAAERGVKATIAHDGMEKILR